MTVLPIEINVALSIMPCPVVGAGGVWFSNLISFNGVVPKATKVASKELMFELGSLFADARKKVDVYVTNDGKDKETKEELVLQSKNPLFVSIGKDNMVKTALLKHRKSPPLVANTGKDKELNSVLL